MSDSRQRRLAQLDATLAPVVAAVSRMGVELHSIADLKQIDRVPPDVIRYLESAIGATENLDAKAAIADVLGGSPWASPSSSGVLLQEYARLPRFVGRSSVQEVILAALERLADASFLTDYVELLDRESDPSNRAIVPYIIAAASSEEAAACLVRLLQNRDIRTNVLDALRTMSRPVLVRTVPRELVEEIAVDASGDDQSRGEARRLLRKLS